MSDKRNLLDYAAPQRKYAWSREEGPGCLVFLLIVGLPALMWFLYELRDLPYRPPQDMSPFFDDQTRAVISAVFCTVGVFWGFAVFRVLAFRLKKRGT
jgi:hypothetical protein